MEIILFLNQSIVYIIGITFIIGLIFSKKYWNRPSVLILVYLGIVFGIEVICITVLNNQWLYNIQSASEFIIVAIIFYRSVDEVISRKIVLSLFVLGMVCLIANAIFISSIWTYLTYGFGFASVAISFMCFVYLFEMAKTEEIIYQSRVLLYWLSIGLLVYHLCNLPITVLINNLPKIGNVDVLLTIQSVSGLVMYFCFISGFILSKWTVNF